MACRVRRVFCRAVVQSVYEEVIVPDQQFHAERAKGFGGSDIADLFGLEWSCARKICYDKSGTPRDDPSVNPFDNHHTQRGTLFEDDIVRLGAELTGFFIKEAAFARHPEYEFLLGHPDRLIFDPKRPEKGVGILEVKCPGENAFAEYVRDGLPVNYLLQVQHYMLITGLKWACFFCFNTEKMAFIEPLPEIEADPEIHAEIVRVAKETVGRIASGDFPAKLAPSDARCQNCSWKAQCQGDDLVSPEVDETLAPHVKEYKAATAIKEMAETNLKIAKSKIELRMVGRKRVKTKHGTAKYITRNGSSISTRELREYHPDIAKQLERPSPSTYLRVD